MKQNFLFTWAGAPQSVSPGDGILPMRGKSQHLHSLGSAQAASHSDGRTQRNSYPPEFIIKINYTQ